MNLDELKKVRKENFLAHKKKKREYYLKSKASKIEIDYAAELNSSNFLEKIKEIAHKQKEYIDGRKDAIVTKMNQYKELKKEYYEQNKDKRLEYDKEYREKKRDELKAYRQEYYKKLKQKQDNNLMKEE